MFHIKELTVGKIDAAYSTMPKAPTRAATAATTGMPRLETPAMTRDGDGEGVMMSAPPVPLPVPLAAPEELATAEKVVVQGTVSVTSVSKVVVTEEG
jgi:formate-dependent phosphoribosylglycinamide formyltransferase (GAR transformylase)